MRRFIYLIVLLNFVVILCNGQSILNSIDVKPIAPKGYVLFTEAGAIEALKAKAELKIATKQLALKDSIIIQLKLKAESQKQIAEAQKAIISKQKHQILWQNVKVYSGWGVALAVLLFKI